LKTPLEWSKGVRACRNWMKDFRPSERGLLLSRLPLRQVPNAKPTIWHVRRNGAGVLIPWKLVDVGSGGLVAVCGFEEFFELRQVFHFDFFGCASSRPEVTPMGS